MSTARILGILLFAFTLGGAEPIRVALYKSHEWQYNNWGIHHIPELLKADDFRVDTINNLRKETLDKYDVLIISTTTKLSQIDSVDADRGKTGTDWRKSLLNFVQRGGGLFFGHNAAGFEGPFAEWKLFPDIVTANSGKIANGIFHGVQGGNPALPERFGHLYDHITFTPGEKGKTIAVNFERKPAIVGGEIEAGKVIYCGIAFGLTWGRKEPVNASDAQILGALVRWLNTGRHEQVSLAETGKTLFAEVERYNSALESQETARYNSLPAPEFTDRVMWLPIYSIKPGVNNTQRDAIDKMLLHVEQMGFNKVMIMAKFGSFMYRTDLETTEHSYATASFDPAAYAIGEARRRNMKIGLILAPFCCRNDWTVYKPNLTRAEAEQLKNNATTLERIDANRAWGRFNCPDDPQVRQRAFNIAAELIEKFNPDEINLDYIRYKDNYGTSCFCDYSQERKAEFHKSHPEIPLAGVDGEYARHSLTSFVREFTALCKKAKPDILISTYTISAPSFKAPDWVNQYEVDIHSKYVSRHLSGPESALQDIPVLMKQYGEWASAVHPSVRFAPIIASFDRKSGERLAAEIKIVGNSEKELSFPLKRIEYFEYNYLLAPGEKHELDLPAARGVSKIFGGTLQ